jgi:hypothetical protein
MPSFNVRSRKTGPLTTVTVEAEDREHAIAQAIAEAEEGGSIEVLQVEEAAVEAAPQSKK